MIYILQLCLFCGLFTLFIVAGTRGKAENALFFYPCQGLPGLLTRECFALTETMRSPGELLSITATCLKAKMLALPL